MSLGSDAQREVTRIALIGVREAGFALAGSGAIREHGIIERPTEDVDLFTAIPIQQCSAVPSTGLPGTCAMPGTPPQWISSGRE